MDARLFEAFADGLIPVIARHCAQAVDDAVAPLLRRIAELEDRKPESIQLDFGAISQLVAQEVARIPPPEPGKSVTVDDVRPVLQELVAALPKPVDGKDGVGVTVDDVAPLISAEIAKAVSSIPVPKDGEPGAAGEKGADGKDGVGVTVDDVAPLISAEIAKAVSAIPVPKDGEPGAAGEKGADGKDGVGVTVDDVAPLISAEIAKAVSAIPVPKDGEPGAAGEKGADGKDGVGVTVDDVAPLISAEIAKAVSAIPVPKDGELGAAGEKGDPGRDGRDASDIPMLKGFITEQVAATFGDVLKAFSFTTPDHGRTLVFAADFNGQSIHQEIKTALVLDNGVWRLEPFKKGDGVSFGGSFFIAQEDTEDKPETSKAWRLAVKRGRDGRDGKSGAPGERGEKGERGELGPRGYSA